MSGFLHTDEIGQDAVKIAAEAAIERDGKFNLIVVPEDEDYLESPMANEKLAPILSFFYKHIASTRLYFLAPEVRYVYRTENDKFC